MAEAGVAVKGVGDAAEKASERSRAALDTLSNRAGLLGAAMVAAAGVVVNAWANFDQQMSAVQAATHESAANMTLLRDAALEAGARTVFSATEAAGAVEELAKAGLSAQDILNGGLNGALDLASAGAMDVAEAAGIASIALQQFQLPGSEASHVADLLAAGAGKAMGSVSDLGMALRQAGQVANSTGLTIEETTAGLAAFASAGLLGSDAGTSFKAMLQRLTPQSAEAQAKMDELGISAYDAQGNFIGLSKFAGNLQAALKDLTPEQRNAALATIFGSDAVRAANVLYSEGEQGIRDWIAAVDDTGYAAETARTRLDNLKGDLEQLRGSVETAFVGMGESADGPLRQVIQSATNMVNAFANLPDAVQGGTLAIVGGGGLVLLGVAGMAKVVTSVKEAVTAFRALSTTAKAAGGAAGIALAIGTAGFMAWANAQAEADSKAQALSDTLDAQTGALTANSTAWVEAELTKSQSFGMFNDKSMVEAAEEMGISLDLLTQAYLGNADAASEAKAQAEAWADDNFDFALAHESVADRFVRNIDDQNARLLTAQEIQQAKLDIDHAAGRQQAGLSDAYDGTTESIGAQIPTLESLIAAQAEAAGVVLSEREAQRQLQQAIDDATASVAENTATLDIGTDAGRANQAALDDIADSTMDVIAAMRENGATQDELKAQMQASRDVFLSTATAMGMGADEANRLADEMGLIPDKVNVPVTVDTSQAEARLAAFKQLLRMPDVVITAEMRTQGGYYANRAAGGIVYGPGTSTSDSIPARLSNGEYVVKASAVKHYGKSTFDALNAQRFAVGGYVGGGGRVGDSAAGGGGNTYNYTINEVSDARGTAAALARREGMLRL